MLYDPHNSIAGCIGYSLMTPEERQALLESIGSEARVCKIGTFQGATCRFLARQRPGCQFLCVDDFSIPDDQGAEHTLHCWMQNKLPNMRLYYGTSQEFLRDARLASYDVILVDGAHDYESCRVDLAVAQALAVPGGLLLAHDYRSLPSPGVTRAVDELCLIRGLTVASVVVSLGFIRL